MSEPDRQNPFDRVLKAALEANAPAGDGPHPDAEVVAAWFDRRLDADQARAVERHLADCGRCQAVAAALTHVSEPLPATQPAWRLWGFRWLVPVGAAAAALTLWVAWPRPDGAPMTVVPERAQARLEEAAPSVADPVRAVAVPQAESRADRPSVGLKKERDAQTSHADPVATPAGAGAAPRQRPQDATSADALAVAEPVSAAPVPLAPAAAPAAVPAAPPVAAGAASSKVAAPPAVRDEQRAAAQAQAGLAVRAAGRPAGLAGEEAKEATASPRWRIVAGRTLERSASGDGPWTAVALPVATPLAAFSAPGARVCWVVGAGGVVLVSTDGQRFRQVPFPERADLSSIRAADGLSATVTLADGRRFRTEDQGATWAQLRP